MDKRQTKNNSIIVTSQSIIYFRLFLHCKAPASPPPGGKKLASRLHKALLLALSTKFLHIFSLCKKAKSTIQGFLNDKVVSKCTMLLLFISCIFLSFSKQRYMKSLSGKVWYHACQRIHDVDPFYGCWAVFLFRKIDGKIHLNLRKNLKSKLYGTVVGVSRMRHHHWYSPFWGVSSRIPSLLKGSSLSSERAYLFGSSINNHYQQNFPYTNKGGEDFHSQRFILLDNQIRCDH